MRVKSFIFHAKMVAWETGLCQQVDDCQPSNSGRHCVLETNEKGRSFAV